MKTGGECENCGSWFETQRYEDQGYGLCPGCDERSKREIMTRPDSIMDAETWVAINCMAASVRIERGLWLPTITRIEPNPRDVVESLKRRDEAIWNAALEEVVNYIEANGHNSGWKQIKFHIHLNMKTPSKEGV